MEVTLGLYDLVVMLSKHTMSHIFHKKITNGLPVAKTLIKYYNDDSEEKKNKKRNQFI